MVKLLVLEELLTGGSIYKENNSSVLGRKREIQELKENIFKIKKDTHVELVI